MNDMSKMCQKCAIKNTGAVFAQDNQDAKKSIKSCLRELCSSLLL